MVVLKSLGKNVPANLEEDEDMENLHFTNDKGKIAQLAFAGQTECNEEQDNTQADDVISLLSS